MEFSHGMIETRPFSSVQSAIKDFHAQLKEAIASVQSIESMDYNYERFDR